jgi:hypothetical protein
MLNSRRSFLNGVTAVLAAITAACSKLSKPTSTSTGGTPAGMPPAFGTAPEVGPPVSTATFAEAEKLVQFPLKADERSTAALNWRKSMAPLYERRVGPRKFSPPPSVSPATRWDPMLPGQPSGPTLDRFVRPAADPRPLPSSEADIAFAPLSQLSRWVESRQLTSTRLTHIYLDRLRQFDPKLRCLIQQLTLFHRNA